MKRFWIYILECTNHSFYTGYTVDIIKRYRAHCSGTAKCKYTQQFKPVRILQCWYADNKSLAMQVESFIKKMPRKKKEFIIEQPHHLQTWFAIHPLSKHDLATLFEST